MRHFSWLLSLPLFVAFVVFALQNRTQVSLSFWPFDAQMNMPVSVLSLGLLVIGFVLGSFVTGLTILRQTFINRRLTREVASLNKKLEEKTPLSSQPTILYNGRYQTVPPQEKPARRKGWFGAKK
jgi:uncharacterized integral membrane protein